MIGTRQWRRRTFASLQHPNFRRFFAGQAVSLVGTWMQMIAQGWLVLELTGSATWLGFAVALQFLPVLLLGPYAGLVADRVAKRPLLIATAVAGALQSAVLAALTVSGTVTVGWVLALAAVLGVVNAFDNPTRQAFIREMVPPEGVRNAVSLNSVLVNAARAIGPAVAGVLIAASGVAACFALNTVSFLAVIAAYRSMDTGRLVPSLPVARLPGQIRQGLRYVWRTPELRVPLVMMTVVGTLTYEFAVSIPALAADTFGEGPEAYGAMTAAMGAGAVLGGLASAGRTATGTAPLALAAAAFGGTDMLVALAPTAGTAALALFATGAASVWFLSTANATLQLAARPEMRGRVMALWSVAFLGSTPLGGPLIGWIAEQAGARWAVAVGAVAALAAAAYGASSLRRGAAPAGEAIPAPGRTVAGHAPPAAANPDF